MVAESLFKFVTLFLSLTRGVQPVEFMVTGPVVRVELRLDGNPAAEINGPPWKAAVNLGAAFVPHELVAPIRHLACDNRSCLPAGTLGSGDEGDRNDPVSHMCPEWKRGQPPFSWP